MSNISDQAQHAQDSARVNGQFGVQIPTAAPDSVGANLKPELPRVELRVRLQRWVNDYAVEVGSDSFDANQILDTMSVDKIEAMDDGDELFFAAVRAGLVEEHSGPFDVDLDSSNIEEYVAERKAVGQWGVARQRVRSFEEIRASYQELAERQKQLTQDEFNLAREELVATILDEFDGATEAVIYNDGAEEGESRFAVSEVRGLDGVLWESDDDIDGVFGRFSDVAPGMDRFGLRHLAQPADLDHAKAWFGIKF